MRSSQGSSSRAAKKDPLLSGSNQKQSGGRCSHLCTCFLPILGGGLIILVLVELLMRSNTSFQDSTISGALAAYEPYIAILTPAMLGALIMFLVTIARSIQITVYFGRASGTSSLSLSAVNLIAAVFNILAYLGFVVLAVVKTTDGADPQADRIHFYGGLVYFVCSALYGILQSYLLWKQTQYPKLLTLVFVTIAAAGFLVTALYGITRGNEFQWLAVVLASVYVMLFAVLFHIDPVEDELAAFFCCKSKRASV